MSEPDGDHPKSAPGSEPTLIEPQAQGQGVLPAHAPSTWHARSASKFTHEQLPFTQVGDYELLDEIGRGGMGVVFRARHVRLQRLVALKMILGGSLANSDDLHRFETEVSAAARLQHSGIVSLFEVGTYDGQPFFSMELISGVSLAQLLVNGPLPSGQAAQILEATARAVHFAHTQGIIHRDLKPANILLDSNEEPKVTDFGLAKLMTTDSGQTRTGAVLGTPSYIAPEQAAGRKDIGPSCDIYSLGAILYEMLTGTPPFRGETPLATLKLVAEQEPVPPRLLNPGVGRDLETICLKCLEKNRHQRYATAEALADDIGRYRQGEPISARRLSAPARAVKWCRRKPATASLIAVVFASLVGFGLYEWHIAWSERASRQKAERLQKLAQLRAKGMRRLLYLAQIRQAQQSLNEADLTSAERILAAWEPKQASDLREWEWYFLQSQCRALLPGHRERTNSVAFRPDGQHLASAGGPPGRPGSVKIWKLSDGSLVNTLEGHRDVVSAVSYSPDGNLLASSSLDGQVMIWDAKDGRRLATLASKNEAFYCVAFHPDSQQLAAAGKTSVIYRWSRSDDTSGTWQPQDSITGHTKPVTSLAFHADGHTLASGSEDRTVRTWQLDTGKNIGTLRGHDGIVTSLAFSPWGRILASGGGAQHQGGEVRFWDLQTGRSVASYYGLSDRVLSLSYSSDGKLAAGSRDGLVRVWETAISNEAKVFRGDAQVVYALQFGPDGRRLALGGRDGHIRLCNASGGQEMFNIPAGQADLVAIDPAGDLLAVADSWSGVQLWSLESGERIANLDPTVKAASVQFSPDGTRLAVGGDDRILRIYSIADREQAPVYLVGHSSIVSAICFHPGGGLIASSSRHEDRVRLWDVDQGKPVKILEGHRNGVLSVAFNKAGTLLASGSYDKTVRVWDLRQGTSFALEGHQGSVNCVAFSPVDSQLASAGTDATIRLWDLNNRNEYSRLEGSSGPIYSLAYHRSGLRLASVGLESRLRLWDLATGQEMLELEVPAGPLSQVVFSADGRRLACVGRNLGLQVWNAPPAGEAVVQR